MSLQRAAHSISTLHAIEKKFDDESGVPCRTTAHSTWSDAQDIKKIVQVVVESKLLSNIPERRHTSFPKIHFNPLHKWDREQCIDWIKRKVKEHSMRGEGDQSDSDASD